MPKLEWFPFCGCNMRIKTFKYPNGDEGLEPYGLHLSGCIMHAVIWNTDPLDGWTEDKLAEAWNYRWEKGERE